MKLKQFLSFVYSLKGKQKKKNLYMSSILIEGGKYDY